jgi:hypothetical protein
MYETAVLHALYSHDNVTKFINEDANHAVWHMLFLDSTAAVFPVPKTFLWLLCHIFTRTDKACLLRHIRASF